MKIDKSELFRYLGHRGQEYSPALDAMADKAIEDCLALVTPRSVIKKYDLAFSPLRLQGTNAILQGKDIAEHLVDCAQVYLIGATVGFEVEKKVSLLMRERPLEAVLLDSASICAAESYCDELCEKLQAENQSLLTERFSCGYGDFPLSAQKDFVSLLELPKKIGVFMNEESFMLSPQKSVTAVVGIRQGNSNKERRACGNKCVSCANVSCAYRRDR